VLGKKKEQKDYEIERKTNKKIRNLKKKKKQENQELEKEMSKRTKHKPNGSKAQEKR
jgi:hypothetical protein